MLKRTDHKKKDQEHKMNIVIRKFQPSDDEAVMAIFQNGTQEHIIPSFKYAISQPLHITVTLCFFTVGYILGGGSVVLALLAGGLWIGLLYYCCYEFYAGYVRSKLNTDMRDIAGFYLSSPDNCFWVAEAEINGQPQIMGIVAVEGKELPDSGQKYGELFRMNVLSTSRRTGLASRLCETVIDFCKERRFSKIVLHVTFTQTAAIAFYRKMGFALVRTDEKAEAQCWSLWLARSAMLRMEKILQP
ncbi:probable N-acetyltransferase CML1 [Pygocentrus nattereri]|uniref:probable N-acetyltransferase CML1 n=1 Tax=Pygocentrus nattereri TaxID=42514 RepID=UPI0008143310|nr:probable N-acetyltransferase CML1 [Pygocentrus nattereri]